MITKTYKLAEAIDEKLAAYRSWKIKREKVRLFNEVKQEWRVKQFEECLKKGNKCSACPYPGCKEVCHGSK